MLSCTSKSVLLLLAHIVSTHSYGPVHEPGERQINVLKRAVVAVAATGAADSPATSSIVLAAGCFWSVELAFSRLPGVLQTEVGYTGGHHPQPTYTVVSGGYSGHAEAVRVVFDPSAVSLSDLLDVFFDCHDPTTKDRQGNDVGTQYRSAIFYASDAEHAIASAAIELEQERLGRPVATTLEPLREWAAAESYHRTPCPSPSMFAPRPTHSPRRNCSVCPEKYLAKLGQTDAKGATEPIRCYG
jgi:peptide-methionine (S)-S-oxide reductase